MLIHAMCCRQSPPRSPLAAHSLPPPPFSRSTWGENNKTKHFAGKYGVRGSRAACIRTRHRAALAMPVLHTHTVHTQPHHIQACCAVSRAQLRSAQEAMPTSVPTRRFMACHIIIWGCNRLRYSPACTHPSVLIGCTHVHGNTRTAQHGLPALCVAMSMFALLPCVPRLQLFLVHALSTLSNPSSQRHRHPSSLDKVYRAHLFALTQAFLLPAHAGAL